jgi:hypothetical protein
LNTTKKEKYMHLIYKRALECLLTGVEYNTDHLPSHTKHCGRGVPFLGKIELEKLSVLSAMTNE